MIGLVIEVRLEYAAGRGGHGARNVTNIRIRTPASQNGDPALAVPLISKSNGRTITSEQYCVALSRSDLCVAYSRFQCWDPALAVINPSESNGRTITSEQYCVPRSRSGHGCRMAACRSELAPEWLPHKRLEPK